MTSWVDDSAETCSAAIPFVSGPETTRRLAPHRPTPSSHRSFANWRSIFFSWAWAVVEANPRVEKSEFPWLARGAERGELQAAEGVPVSHAMRVRPPEYKRRERESEGIRKRRDPGDAPRPETKKEPRPDTKKSTSNRRNHPTRPDPLPSTHDEAESQPYSLRGGPRPPRPCSAFDAGASRK